MEQTWNRLKSLIRVDFDIEVAHNDTYITKIKVLQKLNHN